MPDLERLIRFVNEAPAGTMVPVDSLRELLADETLESAPEEDRRLTPAEAAEWLHHRLGGRKRSAAAVRKVMRTGFRGVVLKSYPYGRERRTTEADLRAFVAEIGAVPRPLSPETVVPPILAPPCATELQAGAEVDAEDEIAAAQERFRRGSAATPSPATRRRRAAGGA
jgi:hypothetical protein